MTPLAQCDQRKTSAVREVSCTSDGGVSIFGFIAIVKRADGKYDIGYALHYVDFK